MDQVSQVKRQIRIEQWRKNITECQASGMSVRSWCKQNNLCEQTYYKYLRRFRQELCDSLPVPVEPPEKPVQFSKLTVQTPVPHAQAAVIIHLPNATVEVQNGVDQQTVEAVLLHLLPFTALSKQQKQTASTFIHICIICCCICPTPIGAIIQRNWIT